MQYFVHGCDGVSSRHLDVTSLFKKIIILYIYIKKIKKYEAFVKYIKNSLIL